jgi:hypothetical protein
MGVLSVICGGRVRWMCGAFVGEEMDRSSVRDKFRRLKWAL